MYDETRHTHQLETQINPSHQLIIEHLDLVKLLALIVYRRLGGIAKRILQLDDLVSAGNLGLVKAAKDYDPEQSYGQFKPYAQLRIRGEILDYLRQTDFLNQRQRLSSGHLG